MDLKLTENHSWCILYFFSIHMVHIFLAEGLLLAPRWCCTVGSRRLLWSLNRVGENRGSGLTEIWTVGFEVSGFAAVETGPHIGHLTSTRLLGAEGTLCGRTAQINPAQVR